MGIRFNCPNGHKLNVKDHLAGKRGVCPDCGAKFVIPAAGAVGGQTAEVVLPVASAASGTLSVTQVKNRGAETEFPSIEIAVAESHAQPMPPPAPAPGQLPLPPAAAPPVAPRELDLSAVPAKQPETLVSSYLVQRQRRRRLQMKLAILLIVAVIALAIILIWVLRRGPVGPAASLDRPTSLAHSPAAAYLAETRQLDC